MHRSGGCHAKSLTGKIKDWKHLSVSHRSIVIIYLFYISAVHLQVWDPLMCCEMVEEFNVCILQGFQLLTQALSRWDEDGGVAGRSSPRKMWNI